MIMIGYAATRNLQAHFRLTVAEGQLNKYHYDYVNRVPRLDYDSWRHQWHYLRS